MLRLLAAPADALRAREKCETHAAPAGGPECDVRCAAQLFRRQGKMLQPLAAPVDALRDREKCETHTAPAGGPECDVTCVARFLTHTTHLLWRQDKMQRQIVAPADVLRARENARCMLHLPDDLNET
jgi:hypothetical protein